MPADVPIAASCVSPAAPGIPETAPAKWTVGTLSYNRKQLGGLILWLLWGDFTLTLMLSVMPQLLPLSLKEVGASNTLIAFVIGSWLHGTAAGRALGLDAKALILTDRKRK